MNAVFGKGGAAVSDADYNGWGDSPDRERLVYERVSDDVAEVSYKPSEKQLKAVPRDRPILQVPLARFDASDGSITIIPRRTRPSMSMLGRKYPWLENIKIDMGRFNFPEDSDQAAGELFNLPSGFMGDWTWGLGVLKVNQPIIDIFRQSKTISYLHIARSGPSRLDGPRYVIGVNDWWQLVGDMGRITSIHQKEGLSERRIVAHNHLLANSEGFERKQMPTRRNALTELISRTGPALSKTDRTSLVSEVGKRSDQIARQEPKALAALQKTILSVNFALDFLAVFTAMSCGQSVAVAVQSGRVQLLIRDPVKALSVSLWRNFLSSPLSKIVASSARRLSNAGRGVTRPVDALC